FFFENSSVGYVCGESGFIVKLHSYVTEVNQASTIVPSEFGLTQNYPNPFNPSTKIAFDLPKQSFVRLKVFDITGREVAVLVNKDLHAGSYSVDFSGEGFTSGVYLYRIEAGDFIRTKR